MTIDDAIAAGRLRRRLPSPAARRQIRLAAGITQKHVADAIGIDRSEVAKWELGTRQPGRRHLAAYVALLDRLAREAA